MNLVLVALSTLPIFFILFCCFWHLFIYYLHLLICFFRLIIFSTFNIFTPRSLPMSQQYESLLYNFMKDTNGIIYIKFDVFLHCYN